MGSDAPAQFAVTNFDGETIGEFAITPGGQIVTDREETRELVETTAVREGWRPGTVIAGLQAGWTNGYISIAPVNGCAAHD